MDLVSVSSFLNVQCQCQYTHTAYFSEVQQHSLIKWGSGMGILIWAALLGWFTSGQSTGPVTETLPDLVPELTR